MSPVEALAPEREKDAAPLFAALGDEPPAAYSWGRE